MKPAIPCLPLLAVLAAGSAHAQSAPAQRPDFSGVYSPAGLAVQPCGHNEWLRRSFETDEWCFGSDEGFPFSEQGLANWREFSPLEDPVLRCIESFPRSAMRGRVMRITLGRDTVEIAYWFDGQWHARRVHLNADAPPAGTEPTDFGYSTGRWAGDTLIVETTHTKGGPMYNDHKPSSPEARFTERFWLAPDGRNLLMDLAIDDPVNYTKPFLLNRQEWIWSPDRELDRSECTPSSIWIDPDEGE